MKKENKENSLEKNLEEIMELKPLVKAITILSKLFMWIFCIAFVILFLAGALSTLYASINGLEAFKNNEYLWELFLEINSFGELEGASALEGSKVLVIICEIALPYLIYALCCSFVAVCSIKPAKFLAGVTSEEELFTEEKLEELKKTKSLVYMLLFICAFAWFGFFSYFAIVFAIEVIAYLFKVCVDNKKVKKTTKKKSEK